MVNHVREYQTLVSLAQLKLHDTATVTLALQNMSPCRYRPPTTTVIRALNSGTSTPSSRMYTRSSPPWPGCLRSDWRSSSGIRR
jgi:hypothetical protein